MVFHQHRRSTVHPQHLMGGFFGEGISQELIDTYGRDNLQIQVNFCHEHGKEVFWSLRMNDTHDAHPKGYRTHYTGLASFKQDHPHCLMGEPEDWDRHAGGLKQWWTRLDCQPSRGQGAHTLTDRGGMPGIRR